MHTITIPQVKQLIQHVAIGQREPLMLWGPPGCGKSEAVQQVALGDHACPAWLTKLIPDIVTRWLLKGQLVDIRLSQYDSVDLRGIPVPTEDTLTVWHAPATLPFKGNHNFSADHLILLFLDEINSAAPAVAAVAYQLINDRRVGEHELMDNVVLIAAGNREGDRGVTNRMPTPLANRFTHAEVGLDPDAWCFWAQEAGLPAVGVAFIQFRKALLSTFDPAKPDKAFATPRTWRKALNYYSADMPADIKQAAISGAIGVGPAAEFWGFVSVWSKMIPLSEIERDPLGVKLPEEASMRYAVTVAVSGSMTKDNVGPLNTFLMRLDPEFSILAWQLAIQRDKNVARTKEFIDFSKKYRAVWA